MRARRIARTKQPFVGCVTQVEIQQSHSIGGYLRCRTTATQNWWVVIPPAQFKSLASFLRPLRDDLRDEYTMADAKRVIKWLRAKMICIECVVRVGDEDEHYYDCVMAGLMKGESNV